MIVQCPQCQKSYNVPDEQAGRQAKCDACGQVFTLDTEASAGRVDEPNPYGGHAAADQSGGYGAAPPTAQPGYGGGSTYAQPAVPARTTSGVAVAALVCGLIGILVAPIGLLAIILGIVALTQTGKAENNVGGGGMAVAGMVCGAIGLVLGVVFLLIALMLPALGTARNTARKMTNSTQMRGIHMGMVTFSQNNRTSTGDGFFPGLKSDGSTVPTFTWPSAQGTFASSSAAGCDPATRYTVMLNKSFFTPEYMLNPVDKGATVNRSNANATGVFQEVMPIGFPGGADTTVSSNNFSYAMLQINDADEDRRKEWSETINSQAIVMGDRNVGPAAGSGQAESVWTEAGSGEWEGTVVFNDGSTNFISEIDMNGNLGPVASNTRYNLQRTNPLDNLFDESDQGETPGANCELVFADCTSDANQYGAPDKP